jgi:hypothetical protein
MKAVLVVIREAIPVHNESQRSDAAYLSKIYLLPSLGRNVELQRRCVA